jgi:hypothetical protein
MKGSTQTALALGVGYVLGRRRKMRTTTLLAAAAATGGVGGLTGALVRRGMKMLGSTEALSKVAPQVGEIADTVRGDLLTVAKAAATEAVSNRVGSLSDSLHERAELVRNPGAAVAGAGEAARSGADQATRRLRRRGQEAEGDEDADMPTSEEDADMPTSEEESDFEEPDEPEDDEREAAPRQARTATRRRSSETPPVRRRTTTRRQSPVARTGR